MRNLRIQFLMGTVLMLLFQSCKKKDETAYINPELKKHFNFQKGSYWIYRDSLTGDIDTLMVSGTATSITERDPGRSIFLIERQRSDLWFRKFQPFLTGYLELTDNSILYVFPSKKYGFGTGIESFSDPTRLQSYTLNGIFFDSVVKIQPDSNVFYVRKDIGLVKMRFVLDTGESNLGIAAMEDC